MANIFLSVPILDKPELKMIYSTYQAILSCRDHNVRIYFNENDSLISRVRNVHLSEFLYNYTECDYFMSLDSDLELLNCYPSSNIFTKLIAHDLDFVGAEYAIKKPGVRRSSSISIDGEQSEFDTGLKEMLWLSTGCWCIKRSAVERMAAAYPELTYNGDDNATGKLIHGLYIPMLYDIKKDDFPGSVPPFRKYLSEDWSFCHRWRAMGGKIYADTSIVLRHIGKIPYTLYDVDVVKKPVNGHEQLSPPNPGFELGRD
jgi:hypothetical protein